MGEFNRRESRQHQFTVTDRVPSEVIVDAVADVKGQSPLECPPLYESIDTDAIDEIFRNRDSGSVQFSFAGCTVTLQGDEHVYVEEHEQQTSQ